MDFVISRCCFSLISIHLSFTKNSIDAGAFHTYILYVTMHLLCITTLNISPIHRAVLQNVYNPWPPLWSDAMFEFGGGGDEKGRGQL